MPVLRNISQLATCPPDQPQRDAGLIGNAAVAWEGATVKWVGPEHDLPDTWRDEPAVDCGGRLVVPGLVDCHTHLAFGGWRADEFDLRIRGATYQEIAAAGGGITSTVKATRASTADQLRARAGAALDGMLALGVTTVEAKSGYGLDAANELKQLAVYRDLDAEHVVDIVPTFLGAHIIPPEYRDDRQHYLRLLCDELLPAVAERQLARFCDVFVEEGAYTEHEARAILGRARDCGLGLKIHADQLSDGGGAALAAELGAVSAEHLEYANPEGIRSLARSGTVAVSLPLASLYLDERFMPARTFMEHGVRVAVATDFNPGSAPSYHLPLALTLACLKQSMTPQEALNGATTVAARALRLHEHIGLILPGYAADLALIDAPSLNHWLYHFLPNACLKVLKNGSWV